MHSQEAEAETDQETDTDSEVADDPNNTAEIEVSTGTQQWNEEHNTEEQENRSDSDEIPDVENLSVATQSLQVRVRKLPQETQETGTGKRRVGRPRKAQTVAQTSEKPLPVGRPVAKKPVGRPRKDAQEPVAKKPVGRPKKVISKVGKQHGIERWFVNEHLSDNEEQNTVEPVTDTDIYTEANLNENTEQLVTEENFRDEL